MSKKTNSIRSPLGRVRALGSAGHGTEHWWQQRMTSLALIPLSLYVLWTFFGYVVPNGYEGAVYWLRSPFSATFIILFLAFGFHHTASGLQVVIEDYIHCEGLKLTCIALVKFLALALTILGVLAAIKVLFGV